MLPGVSVLEERNLVRESFTNQSTSTSEAHARYDYTSKSELTGMPWEPPEKLVEKYEQSSL